MKLHVMSDLHLEFFPDGGEQFVASLDPQGAEVLVLAGDITVARFYLEILAIFQDICAKYQKVIYVPGNHEFYRSRPQDVMNMLRNIEQELAGKLILLDGNHVQLGNRRVLGGTLWFRSFPDNGIWADGLNDFHLIKGFVPWVYQENARHIQALKDELRTSDIVVTHHLPSMQSCAPQYRKDGMDSFNRFFVCELDELVLERKPALWIHGHTHEACDYQLGATRVVCNPKGYPQERKAFNKGLFIEV